MSILNLFYIMNDGTYVEGYEGDNVYKANTCSIVTKKPSAGGYIWDKNSEEWILTLESRKNYIRSFRNLELDRTDKYMLMDFPITEENRDGAIVYRQTLRDLPSKATPEEIIMPDRPSYLDPIS